MGILGREASSHISNNGKPLYMTCQGEREKELRTKHVPT